MRKIREVLRLRAEGFSERQIAQSIDCARSSVQICLWRAERAGVGWPPPADKDDAALETLLYPRRPPGIEVHPAPDFEWIERELRRKHVTRRQLWREYLARHPEGLKYTAFCVKFQQWRRSRGVTLSLTHTPGDRLFVDYAGDPAFFTDPTTGVAQKAWLFVAVWPYSARLYAEATRTQSSADWLGAHVRALEAFNAAPRALVPDNCTTAVKKALRYDPQFNRAYAELAEHYALAVLPARVRKPRDKAAVENGVLIAERRILGALRDRQFLSLAELNTAISQIVAEINTEPFQKREGSRASVFESEERPAAQALPLRRYEYAEWRIGARVHPDHHIEVGRAYYSVHYSLVGQRLDARLSAHTVEIFLRGASIATHARATRRYQRLTLEAHRPPEHRAYLALGIDTLLARAARIGAATREILERQLRHKRHPGEVIREALGVLRLAQDFSPERLEQTASLALEHGLYGYRAVHELIQRPAHSVHATVRSPLGMHPNVRGADYFQLPLKEKLPC
ncbi:MAG: IS21 family transposase [Steroidobacteraceae bacterium]|uniref:IS21 family transposase n=1 Tax=Paraburkholderia sp. TaxID=1926495 RepID=UPI003D6DF271